MMQFPKWRHFPRILNSFCNKRVWRRSCRWSGNTEQVRVLPFLVLLTQSCFTRDDQNIFDIELKIFSPGTGGSSDTIVDYYSQLTQSEVAALFRKYQLDFELYDYNPEPYFEIAQVTAE